MAKYRIENRHPYQRIPRRVWFSLLALIVLVAGGAIVAHQVYNRELRPVSNNQQTQIITIQSGSTVTQIADLLEQKRLVRSAWALELYVHSQQLSDVLQAGTYAFSPSETTPAIVTTMTKGKVTTKLVTILPGRRIDQVQADLINDGFSPASVSAALQPSQYSDVPIMADAPQNVTTLEGLLWPDSYEKDTSTAPTVIIREALEAMGTHITPAVQAAFASENLTVYQGVTLASIVEQEVNKPVDQAQAAQVFLTRLKSGMMLGSDVTADYGSIAAGQQPNLSYDSPYNTLLHTGLPPTPISTISSGALQAVTEPANTNWLYFVTGDDGTTYFSTTLADQQANTAKFCHKLCSQ